MRKYWEIAFVFQPWHTSLMSQFSLFFNTVTIYHFHSSLVGINQSQFNKNVSFHMVSLKHSYKMLSLLKQLFQSLYLFTGLWYKAFSFAEQRLNVLIETQPKSEDIPFWHKMQLITSLIISHLTVGRCGFCVRSSSVFSWVRSSKQHLPIYSCFQHFRLPAFDLVWGLCTIWHLLIHIFGMCIVAFWFVTILCPFILTIFTVFVQRNIFCILQKCPKQARDIIRIFSPMN